MSVASVVIPTWDAASTLGTALDTARNQTVEDIEILVVCDGATPDTIAVASDYEKLDSRVRVLNLPKAAARGERNRHHGVAAAQSPNIVYLADDDLLLPKHVEYVVEALESHDLVQCWNTYIDSQGRLRVLAADISSEAWQTWHLAEPPLNRISITGTAHTVAAYQRVERGWVVPVPGVPADLTLWRQFFELPDLRAATLQRATVIQFPGSERRGLDDVQLAAVRAPWEALVREPDVEDKYDERVRQAEREELLVAGLEFGSLVRDVRRVAADYVELRAEYDRIRDALSPE